MRATNSLARWGLAACLIGSGLLQAQDTGFSKDFKIRLGYTPSTDVSQLRHYYQGFGLNLGYGFASGKLAAELGYFYNTGDPFVTAPDGTKAGTVHYADGTTAAGQAMDPAHAIDDKRNELSGFTVRVSWQAKINEGWDWQAGLQLGTQFKHQYIGDARSLTATAGGATWEDTYQGVPREGGINISPYAGVSWKIDKDSALEFNVMLLRYNAIDYHHYAGTGTYVTTGSAAGLNNTDYPFAYDKLEKNSRMVAHLEIAYVFHF
jgi:hypothetical protein